jgi:hypothetical protein
MSMVAVEDQSMGVTPQTQRSTHVQVMDSHVGSAFCETQCPIVVLAVPEIFVTSTDWHF